MAQSWKQTVRFPVLVLDLDDQSLRMPIQLKVNNGEPYQPLPTHGATWIPALLLLCCILQVAKVSGARGLVLGTLQQWENQDASVGQSPNVFPTISKHVGNWGITWYNLV